MVNRVLRLFRKTLQVPIKEQIGNVQLWLPPEHLLPIYKNKYPLYDSFLPVLAKRLPERSTVIDVGANIGDTCKSMISANSSLNFICVEPDNKFFQYLKFNTRKIPLDQIKLHKVLVTTTLDSYKLVGKGGTKSMVVTKKSGMKSTTLDNMYDDLKTDSLISLIKSDVDGYDFDVLLSGKSIISKYQPLVFSEFSFIDSRSIDKYLELVKYMISANYITAFLFKNTGEFDSLISLNKLEEFLRKQVDANNQFSTVSYFDILFSASNFQKIAEIAVSDFRNL